MKSLLITLAALITLLQFSTAINAAETDAVIAKLGSIEFKSSQIKSMINGLDAESKKQLRTNPSAITPLIRSEIIRQAVLKEAVDKQWDKRPEVQIQATHAVEQAVITSYLNNLTRPPVSYPSEDEVKQFYEANKNSLTQPAQYRVAQIFLSSSTTQANVAEENANKLAIEAKQKNADFAQIARKNSQHAESAARGGELDWMSEDQIIPELRSKITGMSNGEISSPIKSSTGWHIVKLLEKKAAGIRPYSDVRSALISNLRLNRAKQNEQEYLEAMLKTQKFEINEQLLNGAVK